MQRLVLFCFILLNTSFSWASEPSVEALLKEIVSIEVASEQNEKRLIELFKHPDQGVSISDKIRLAPIYWQSGRLDKAREILEGVSENYEQYSPKYKIETLLTWASFELRRNDFRSAEQFAKQASEVASAEHQELVANTYYFLGASLRSQRKELEAKHYFELALQKFEQDGNEQGRYNVLNSLGVMFKDIGDLANGIK